MTIAAAFLVSGLLAISPAQQSQETVTAVVIHGNQIVTDEDVLKMSGLTIGAPFTSTTIADVTQRLKASGKFESVEVLKRFSSVDDFTKITIVINASEGAVRIDNIFGGVDKPPQVVEQSMWRSLMVSPLFDAEDGYGVTFGARLAYPKVLGPRSRLSFPLTWGGMRRAGAELEKSFTRGPLSRVESGVAIQQQRNPAYDVNDRRQRVWGRAERYFGPFRAGGTLGWQRVTFAEIPEDSKSLRGDITFDTRLDPVLPRNAVYVTASAERFFFESGSPHQSVTRTRVDARGYIGVIGQQVLVVRALREDNNVPAPLYLRSLLGGWSNLRGFEAGYRTGDTLVAGSLEYRIPVSSPLSVGKLGISLFGDWGTAYEKGQRFRDQKLDNGFGVSGWLALTGFRLAIGVAHGRGAGTRVSFGGGLTF